MNSLWTPDSARFIIHDVLSYQYSAHKEDRGRYDPAASSCGGFGLFSTSTFVCTKLNALCVSPFFSNVRIVASPSRYTSVLTNELASPPYAFLSHNADSPLAQSHDVVSRRTLRRKACDTKPAGLSVVSGTEARAHDVFDNAAAVRCLRDFRIGPNAANEGHARKLRGTSAGECAIQRWRRGGTTAHR